MKGLDKRILRLAVPNILASLSVPLIGIADTAMIGHLPQVAFLGAVAAASVIFDVVFWGAGFLRMGTTALVAQYWGAGLRREGVETLYRALALALMLALVILLARSFIGWAGFALLGGGEEIQFWGRRYFEVRILGVPLVLAMLALNGFFLGTGNVVAPLAATIVANAVNLGADYALIFGRWGCPALGVEGAAWAAVLGNSAALVVASVFLWRGYRGHLIRPGGLFKRAQLGLIFRTNSRLFGRTLFLLAAQFGLVGMVARLGEAPLAAHAVIWQVWALVSFGVDGFAYAAETLVGQSLGGRDFSGARQVAARILQWGLAIGLVFALVYGLALEVIAGQFTRHREVVEAVGLVTWIVAPMQPLNAVVFVLDGIFIGANDLGYLCLAMAAALLLFFVPLALVLVYWMDGGIQGAWLAYSGLMVGRFATLWPRYRGTAWQRTFVT